MQFVHKPPALQPTVDITLSQVKMMPGEFVWFPHFCELRLRGEDRDGKIEGGHVPLSDGNRLGLKIQWSQKSNRLAMKMYQKSKIQVEFDSANSLCNYKSTASPSSRPAMLQDRPSNQCPSGRGWNPLWDSRDGCCTCSILSVLQKFSRRSDVEIIQCHCKPLWIFWTKWSGWKEP